jgi:hypothetical protein
LTHAINPALDEFQSSHAVSVAATDCHFHIFVLPGTKFTDCDKAKDFLTKSGLSFETLPAVDGQDLVVTIGTNQIPRWNEPEYKAALLATRYPPKADPARINYPMTLLILVILVLYVTMVYGPIAAYLVELFPARIRYTSMSLPYHIGNGWFGGMLPLIATAIVASTGDIYRGLWYPITVAGITLVIGALFLRETKPGFDIHD